MTTKPKVIVIVGPTGSGKTDLAIRIAKQFDGELIAADSRTVYRGMDVGTAKPQADSCKLQAPPPLSPPPTGRGRGGGGTFVVQEIPHHLLDIRNPDEPYSVAEFQADAERLILEIAAREKLPIVVGGTGLYISAIVNNFSIPGIPAQPKLRESFAKKSATELLALLEQFDPDAAQTIDRRNPRRIIRALEVSIFTGHPFSALRKAGESPFEFLQIGIQRTRAALYRRIDRRTRVMFRQGLVTEVRRLLDRYDPNIESLRGIIYREVVEYLHDEWNPSLSHDREKVMGRRMRSGTRISRELGQRIMYANHRYARHQLMWFKRDKRIHWVRTAQQAERLVREFL